MYLYLYIYVCIYILKYFESYSVMIIEQDLTNKNQTQSQQPGEDPHGRHRGEHVLLRLRRLRQTP